MSFNCMLVSPYRGGWGSELGCHVVTSVVIVLIIVFTLPEESQWSEEEMGQLYVMACKRFG